MSQTEEIKQRLDIADFIGEYIQLKPAGSGSMKAVCPFHREKTPSFYVSREKQIWHCFGCDEGGDAFAFLMKMEGLDFSEALRQLAEKTGVKIERFVTEVSNEKNRLSHLIDLAARWYHKCLLESDLAASTRAYLERRGVPEDMVRKFELGYAPDQWDALLNFLKKKGYRDQEMVEAGLAVPRQDRTGIYDRFRHRLMFPITDVRGRVVGFTGRQLDDTREGGKYINTPQTTLYNKSQVLYGLSLVKTAIKANGAVIVVEGNLDVVSSHKAGVEAVVASSGTALTEEQLMLLRRFTETILICFDADPAGEHAAKRGIDLAIAGGMNVKVIRMTDGAKDPDELIKKDPELWKRAIANATDVMTYYFEKVFARGLPHTGLEKKQMGTVLLPEIARLQNPIERTHWLHELASCLAVSDTVLEEAIARIKPVSGATVARSRESLPVRAAGGVTTRIIKLADTFFGMLFTRADIRSELVERIRPEDLPDPHRLLYLFFVTQYHAWSNTPTPPQAGNGDFFAILRGNLNQEHSELVPLLDRLALAGERLYRDRDSQSVRDEMMRVVGGLRECSLRDSRLDLARELREAESRGDSVRVDALMKKFNELV